MTGYSTSLIIFVVAQILCTAAGIGMYLNNFGLVGVVLFIFFELAVLFVTTLPAWREYDARKEGVVKRIPPNIR